MPGQVKSADNGVSAAPAGKDGAGPEPADAGIAGDLAADQPVSAPGRLRSAATGLRQRAQAAAAQPGSLSRPAGRPRTAGRTDDGTSAEVPGSPPPGPPVPRLLQQAAAWSWRLLLVGLLIYVAFRVASALRLVVLPCFAALLLTALLQPLTARLRKAGLPSLAATWCTILAVIAVLAGVGTLAANRISADYPTLSFEVRQTAHQVQISLAGPPFHVSSVRLQQYSDQLVQFLSQHKSLVAGTVVTGGKIVLELLTGLVLTVFITFFLLKDGERIWAWLVSALRPQPRRRADNAGMAAWAALVNYVRGTAVVATIHAVSIGLALWILGVPLLVPLIILVFVAAFVPLIGILVAGALAILVTLGTKGLLAAVILLVVFLLENQIESHLLQPLVVGRIVRLHPLAIILVLAVGGIVAGIPGAIVAVPAAAAISYAWPYLRGAEAEPPGEP
jgi:predicted PurR-regulated permease PerM